MNKIFGIKENADYLHREGAYLIPYQNNQIGVVKTPKGYFFLGGGLENGENHFDCLKRECLEETGYSIRIERKLCSAETYTKHPTIGYFHPIQTYYLGTLLDKQAEPTETDHVLHWFPYEELKGKMFVEMQNWALEQLSPFIK
jgi:8-oxo-dGTP diphosphatase